MKRAFDLAVTLGTLPLWLPLLAVVALLVRLRLGNPLFFRQLRPGLHAQPFQLLKFRSMHDRCDHAGHPLPDAERLTPFGFWLRSTSLDELPALFNVLAGHMSLVGPRPLLLRYLPLYSPRQARRHEVRPGLTGWAQVNGRNSISWDQKFELDVWYVDHQSLWLDLRILFQTVWNVFCRRGICAAGSATMPEFTGSTPTE
jgi:lipopolysaccharide/colanic/teichoic acid biosynthesis glycosyltransferase